jgi:hypothetical protein
MNAIKHHKLVYLDVTTVVQLLVLLHAATVVHRSPAC